MMSVVEDGARGSLSVRQRFLASEDAQCFEHVLLSPCTARVGSMPIVAWVSVPPAHDKTNNLSKSPLWCAHTIWYNIR